MRCSNHIAHMGVMGNEWNILVVLEQLGSVRRNSCRWDDDIKIVLKELGVRV